MKTIKQAIPLAALAVALCVPHAFGVIGQSIAIQETNLVLSWPSLGNEHYLVQYRPTLDSSTSWLNLTNAYPANSTNRTTYVIQCCKLVELAGTNMMSLVGNGGESMMMQSAFDPNEPELWAMPADGSGSPVPLAIYPPGVPTNHLFIFEASASEMAMARKSSVSSASMNFALEEIEGGNYEAQRISNGGCDCPDMGFFRVWHIPDWDLNITNYVYEGPTFLSVDFKDYLDRVRKVEVLLDGVASPYAEFTSYEDGGVTNWGVGIYFDRLSNGTHQIQLVTTLGLNELTGDRTILLAISNLTRSISVSNIVMFPDWNEFIQGDTYTFKAQTADSNVNWWVDVYDQWGNYVNTGSGQTSGGDISWTWDLNDWQGNNRDDFDADPFFYAEIGIESLTSGNATNLPQGAPIYKPMPVPVKGFPNRGEWLIAYQDRWFADAPFYGPYGFQADYTNAINLIVGGPWLVGDTAYQLPLKLGTNVYTQAEREASWATFRNAIGDLRVRNLYYNGHGGPTLLGCDYHELDSNGEITAGLFSYAGSRSVLESWQIAKKTKYNRFRFVFLDGCSTAAGDLPNAFNISKQTNAVSFYENHPKHPRPAAFVGWNQDVGEGEGWGFQDDQIEFQSAWMGSWANDSDHPGILTALSRANNFSQWLTQAKLGEALRVYGYQQMTIRDYNRKGDWRWP